jgi:RNA polymerase sigma-70 factor (ECF subfamily)
LELFAFDRVYVDRLRDGDPAVEHHFISYFEPFLHMMLRSRSTPPDQVDDITQESFARVLATLRREGGIRQPDRFGAFVCTTCKNVLYERRRADQKGAPLEDSHYEIPDKVIDLDGFLATKQLMQLVREILDQMSARDSAILRAIFLEEKEKDEVCRQFGIDRDYLRVCLHRAKEKFRVHYDKRHLPRPLPSVARKP